MWFREFKRLLPVLDLRSDIKSATFICGCLLLLAACDSRQLPSLKPLPKTPVKVCEKVVSTILNVALPAELKVMEQEIRGERIVVHLGLPQATDDPMQAICVYGFDRYNAEGDTQLYRKVPTRMAINGQQVGEKDLLAALRKAGFE